MLQSVDVHEQQLWKSKVFFPNTDRHEDGQKRQITSLMNKVTQQVPGWDKDKRTGLFRKTAAGIANGAGAESDRVNRQLGWKGDTQNRSYAVADLEAYVDVQAMQAGFDKDSWRLHHHLGRAGIAVDESWYDVLVPGLTATSELSIRRQEVLHSMQKLAEAYWQALPVNVLKYGMNVVAGLPSVVEVMQTDQYASFSDRVLHAECDSMQKLMQQVPCLAEWQQANYTRAVSGQVAHHATGISTRFSETIEQSQVRSAEAAGLVTQEPVAKRQRVEVHAANISEQELQADIEQWDSHNRQEELKLQLQAKKQAALKLKRMAELQAAIARQDDLDLAQQEETLRRRQLMWNAQGGSALTVQGMSAPTSNQDVQLNNTPFTPELANQAVLSVSSTVEDSTVPAAQPSKVKKVLKKPRHVQSPNN